MIWLSPIMIRTKACTSDFLQLWIVDARSWVEIVRPKFDPDRLFIVWEGVPRPPHPGFKLTAKF